MNRFFKLLCLAAFVCSGCSSTSGPDSDIFASVIIHGKSLDEIYVATATVFKANGYHSNPAGPREMRFEREGSRGEKLARASMMSVNDGPSVVVRIKASIVRLGPDSERLQCEAFIITDAGNSFYEDEARISKRKRKPYQELLDQVALKLK